MRTERVQQQAGFVLHTRPYRNTSLLVEIFSRDHGRVGAIAAGARAAKSRQAPLLQPMQPLSLSWSIRGDLARLTGVEAIGSSGMSAAGRALWCGLYCNELLMRLTHRGDAHPALYDCYADTLAALASDHELALRRFENVLLAECGYGLPLQHDAVGNSIEADLYYRYLADEGFVPFAGPADGAGLNDGYSGRTLLTLAAGELPDPEARSQAKRLLRNAIAQHLDRPLQTGAILRSLERLQPSPKPTIPAAGEAPQEPT